MTNLTSGWQCWNGAEWVDFDRSVPWKHFIMRFIDIEHKRIFWDGPDQEKLPDLGLISREEFIASKTMTLAQRRALEKTIRERSAHKKITFEQALEWRPE